MTIDEVHKFFPLAEVVAARGLRSMTPRVHHQVVTGHIRRSMEQARDMEAFWHRTFWLQGQGHAPFLGLR
jgi:hypothetical protein